MTDLQHHGVLGMKWGVRRQISRNVALIGAEMRARQAFSSREITETEYRSLPSTPIKLGRNFSRISDKEGTLRDFVYATNNENDKLRYRAFFGSAGEKKNVNKNKFEATLKSDKEAISPSFKGRVDTYVKLLDSNIVDPTTHKTVKGREWAWGTSNAISALSTRELGLKTYQLFAQSTHMNTPLHSAYFNEIKKQGYNAILDDADRDFFSKTPVILFPKESGTHVVEVKPITKEDIAQARLNAQLLS